ncbi:phosphatidylglycerophosphatase A [Dechloromonas denitrificans]|jgi:phosphatidylglycerophosphatase A|uniref:phosphatidylglycerophosphatase A family protein n=1 Tax=Dechloromonas denitrificans TaxID=281362 RepID=UPI001CF816EA|nr:phosphatidylglycerophosphatase A [Dechloromonas denitrificans]UCV11274.1 phosphatidylglycerophosphatase A [Dechloromonas denitrificans]
MAKRPTLTFLLAHPAHFLACGCGSGLAPWAPGTFGTLFAWFSFLMFRPHYSDFALLAAFAIAYLAGIWIIDVAGKALGDPDHGSIVWDEIVPFWLVLLMTPDSFLWQLSAFALFRYFDITKPQPARYFDEHVKNGFGVMADDLVAAGYTLLSLALLKIVFA